MNKLQLRTTTETNRPDTAYFMVPEFCLETPPEKPKVSVPPRAEADGGIGLAEGKYAKALEDAALAEALVGGESANLSESDRLMMAQVRAQLDGAYEDLVAEVASSEEFRSRDEGVLTAQSYADSVGWDIAESTEDCETASAMVAVLNRIKEEKLTGISEAKEAEQRAWINTALVGAAGRLRWSRGKGGGAGDTYQS